VRVLVVGAGVMGLTCGVRLAESGHEVHVFARDLPLETTSAVAAAWWYPYRAAPADRVAVWGAQSYAAFTALAESADSGVVMRRSTEVHRTPQPDPAWAAAVPELTREAADELPEGYVDGWSFVSPVVEMPVYLGMLAARLTAADGTLTRMALGGLPAARWTVVVNCAGLANRLLVGDRQLYPVRGQVVRLEKVGIDRVWLDSSADDVTYVVPRSRDIVVGGSDEVDEWDRRPDPALAESILARATRLVPELAGAAVLGHRVGLRPCRPEVRLEVETRRDAGPVVHCYGHGGAGITLSWGCADEVTRLVEQIAGGDRDEAAAPGGRVRGSR
jgi:D-amino-acid oxidase